MKNRLILLLFLVILISCQREYSKEKAMQYWNENQIDLALSEISNAIKAHPDSSSYYAFRAMIYDMLTKYKEEKNDLDKIIALNNNHREVVLAYHQRAVVNTYMESFLDALNDINYFIEHRDTVESLAEAYINKASILYQMKDTTNARAFYCLAMNNNDNSIKVSALLGLSNLAHTHKEALDLINKVLEIDSNNTMALGNRATIYIEQNNVKDAFLDCKKALSINPYIGINNFNLGQIYAMYFNKPDSAMKYFEKVIEFAPHSPQSASAYMNIALMQKDNGNLQEAYKNIQKAGVLMPNNDVIQYNYAHILSDMQKSKEALLAISKAIEINPNEVEYYNTKGVIFIDMLSFNDAIDVFKKCIEIDPKFGGAFYNLGHIYGKQNDHIQSIMYYEKAVRLNFDLESTLVNLALQEIKVNKVSSACFHLNKAYSIGRTDIKPLIDKYCKSN